MNNPYKTKTYTMPIAEPAFGYDIPRPDIEYRGFKIVRDRTNNLWVINSRDGTETPVPLRGNFTQIELAKTTIERYLKKINEGNETNTGT